MQILIINRTDKAQQIRKSNGDIVVIKAYSPYTLETTFKPEINFWTNCTDDRFIVADNVSNLQKILAQLPKKVVDKQKEMLTKTTSSANPNPKETESNEAHKSIEEEPIKKEVVVSTNDTETVTQAKSDSKQLIGDAYNKNKSDRENEIRNLKLSDLKILASKQGVKIPYNCKKADLAELIINSLDN